MGYGGGFVRHNFKNFLTFKYKSNQAYMYKEQDVPQAFYNFAFSNASCICCGVTKASAIVQLAIRFPYGNWVVDELTI